MKKKSASPSHYAGKRYYVSVHYAKWCMSFDTEAEARDYFQGLTPSERIIHNYLQVDGAGKAVLWDTAQSPWLQLARNF